MNHLDIGILIGCSTAVVLVLAWLFVHKDYQFTGSFRVSKRNPPRPPKSPTGTVPPNVTEISRDAA
jgi:hypothetical protein